MTHSVDFFDRQFRRQIEQGDFALNPFEELALPYLGGSLLDLGCGLGNLALAAARKGVQVEALDASPAAVERLQQEADRSGLPIKARQADLARESISGAYDCVVAIGLLSFFPRPRAEHLLNAIRQCTRQGGVAAVNVLTEGTDYLDMFGKDPYTLFGADEIDRFFAGWSILESRRNDFDAPGGTRKQFSTIIARRPA